MKCYRKKIKIPITIFCAFTPLLFFAKHYSDRLTDYSQLESFLREERWVEADVETSSLMKKVFMEAIDSQSFFGFSKIDLSIGVNTMRHPFRSCHSFQRIDQMWTIYSNGKYGLTKQAKIMQEIVDKSDSADIDYHFKEFGDRVGWTDPRWDFLNPQASDKIDILVQKEGALPSRYWAIKNAPKSLSSTDFIYGYRFCLNHK